MTDEQKQALWNEACKDTPQAPGWNRHIRYAASIESAATAPLLSKIAELEAKLAYANEVIDQRNAMLSAALATAPAAPEQQEPKPAAWTPSTRMWHDRIKDAHPNSEPEYWPNALKVEYMEREILDLRRLVAQAPNAQQAEPPPWWPAVEDILNEYGLQAVDFVADFKAAQQAEAQEPYGWHYTNNGGASVFHRGKSNRLDADIQAARDYPSVHHVTVLFTRPQPAQHQLCQGERP